MENAQYKTGKTKLQVLAQIGITDGTYYRVVSNGMFPELDTVDKLSIYFGLTWLDFFEEPDPDPAKPNVLPPALYDTSVSAKDRARLRARAGAGQMDLVMFKVADLEEKLMAMASELRSKLDRA